MDQRQQPPHPFSRNTASPYNRNPFPPSSNPSQFPPSSHPPNATPSYAEQRQRRPSDPPYYNPQRGYGQDGPPMGGPGHTRHQSASSVGHGTPVNRGMPPPSSPQQDRQHQSYGPPPRAPLPAGPTAFSSGRELPALGPRSGMSISDILGGPSVSREQPPPQYGSPIATAVPASSMFGPNRGSPRQQPGPDYAAFRRPRTPEHQRFVGPRDHRANSAGSPPNPTHFSTPEARQFGPPYRGQIVEERQEMRIPNQTGIPPRPNSQPSTYNAAPLREFTKRIETAGRPAEANSRVELSYNRGDFNERHDPRFPYGEQERLERERERERDRAVAMQREMQREREQREIRERAEQERQQEYAHQLAQRNAQAYSRAPEREQPAWMRPQPPYEPQRAPYEPPSERPSQNSNGYEYPGTTTPKYGGHSAYAPNDQRYPQVSQPTPHHPVPTSQFEASTQERHLRLAQAQQQQLNQAIYGQTSGGGPYQAHESPVRRSLEEAQHMQQQRTFLGVQEINRKGRLSPLPQAVQGAQSQMNGPGGEPGIKNEFGRMFSGIGSGVGADMVAPSPVSAGPQSMPFSNTSLMRRDDLDSLQNSPIDIGGQNMARTASKGGGSRRRKLKEEDSRADDDSSTGRRTPSGRGKRAKNHHHHHHHHHHHRPENTSSPNLTPFKSVKGPAVPSPPGLDKEGPSLHHHHVPVSRVHHHHHHVNAKPAVQVNPQIPLPNITIISSAVLDQVKDLPRRHLGHCYYESTLKATSSTVYPKKGRPGYTSTPKPLPRFENSQLNCTYTVKVPRVHLKNSSLKEITARKSLWGTDIYTDDSDVIAAAIHAGWFRGVWDESVDVSLLGLELAGKSIPKKLGANGKDEILLQPPPSGPQNIPRNHDVHIDIVVLPLLEGYGSTIRFGIKSREWGVKREGYQGQHDGMSFMIAKVAFISAAQEAGEMGLRKRKKMISARVAHETSRDEQRITGTEIQTNPDQFGESYERGIGAIKGIGTNSWWKVPPKKIEIVEEIEEPEPEVEQEVEPDVEMEDEVEVEEEEEEEVASPPPQHHIPRTPPRQEPPRHYVPIDPPIPSPISVIDPQIDVERAAELLAERERDGSLSLNVTPIKQARADDLATEAEDTISPARALLELEYAAIGLGVDMGVPSPLQSREIIPGFGGDVEVIREVIPAPVVEAAEPVVVAAEPAEISDEEPITSDLLDTPLGVVLAAARTLLPDVGERGV